MSAPRRTGVAPPQSAPDGTADMPLIDPAEILFPSRGFSLRDRARTALANPNLQTFVERTTVTKDQSRRPTLEAAFGDRTDRLRAAAGEVKQHVLDHLDAYLARFIERAEAAGASVHLASDGEDANAICLALARDASVRTCVKAKSMATEETRLLHAFEAAGIETWETDLGEFIIQLDNDAPSHIVAPMIHKNRASVARAFARELGAPYTEDPEELTAIARQALRERFLRADMGVTGANFLVADTGSVVVCTNEGNARFCATAPRVLLVVAGIEKVVPSLEHLTMFLKLLARSSTAQPLTVYTQILTGPRRAGERDGPERVHIVLIDNGRTNILADPEFRPALRCIRCGACLNACPVYRKIGGHSYGSVTPGPIGSILTPLARSLSMYRELPQASSLCGACAEACPVSIDLPRMLVALRRESASRRVTSLRERMAFKMYALALRASWSYAIARGALRLLLGAAQGLRGRGGPLGAWTRSRELPEPPRESFRAWWSRHERERRR